MDKKLIKYTTRKGKVIECGVVPTDKKDTSAFLIIFDEYEPHTISVWDTDFTNIRYEIPKWLAVGIRDLIINHKDCKEINNEQ